MNSLTFELVVPTDIQARALYELLKARQHHISHVNLPSYDEHVAFVLNNPYRYWYLIYREGKIFGSIYVQFDNSVGINMGSEVDSGELRVVIASLRKLVQPMEPIASLRYRDFFFNIPYSDKNLQCCLEEMGYVPAQTSYVLSD